MLLWPMNYSELCVNFQIHTDLSSYLFLTNFHYVQRKHMYDFNCIEIYFMAQDMVNFVKRSVCVRKECVLCSSVVSCSMYINWVKFVDHAAQIYILTDVCHFFHQLLRKMLKFPIKIVASSISPCSYDTFCIHMRDRGRERNLL